jgi:phosphoribosyl 1,2-cyclic phosphodiesterase
MPNHYQGEFSVHFWGVRGSIPCPGPHTIRYGGNTSCVEMRVNGQRLIFDAGTGIRVLGEAMLGEAALREQQLEAPQAIEAHLFFSHTHWDHIQGFPFFGPAFVQGNCFHIYGATAADGSTILQRLSAQMLHPNFPVPIQIMGGHLYFNDIEAGARIELPDGVLVQAASLNHPGGALGYRVSWGDHVAAYVTDTEHFSDRLDDNILKLIQDADVLIYDCTYTEDEYNHPRQSKVGWGHSTWNAAVALALEAGVRSLAIFHHDPSHTDDFMDRLGREARAVFPNSVVAHEGLVLDLVHCEPQVPQPALCENVTLCS